jgi:hypothetical protein
VALQNGSTLCFKSITGSGGSEGAYTFVKSDMILTPLLTYLTRLKSARYEYVVSHFFSSGRSSGKSFATNCGRVTLALPLAVQASSLIMAIRGRRPSRLSNQ